MVDLKIKGELNHLSQLIDLLWIIISSIHTYSLATAFFLIMQVLPQQSVPGAPLEGRWQFQRLEQIVHLASGDILETIQQVPPESTYRTLDITERELIQHHEAFIMSNLTQYKVVNEYFIKDNILYVVPYPGIEPMPQIISHLSNCQLIIKYVSKHKLGTPYTEFAMYFTR